MTRLSIIALAAVALAAVALVAWRAEASVIATDLFNDPSYSLGGAVYGYDSGPNDGTGFATGWRNGGPTALRIVAPGLYYPGLATSAYGAASPAYYACPYAYCVNSTAVRDFADNTATTDIWVSFLIKDDGVTAQDFANLPNYGGIAVEDASSDFLYIGVPGEQPTTADYSLQTGAGFQQSATAATPAHTVLLVADISDDGEAYLYVDPTVGAALGAPDATIAAPFAPSAATELYWSDSWGWSYGDIRVGTTLADVTPPPSPVPEPTAWAMMLAGFAALGGALRARREVFGTGA